MKPNCEFFKSAPIPHYSFCWTVDRGLCLWLDFKQIGPDKKEWFCSRPDWEERTCESHGQRLLPEAQLVENVAAMDNQVDD